jgi:hypothetical protein
MKCEAFAVKFYDSILYGKASTTKLNYDCKALASVINYHCECDTTIWIINLTSSFTIVICLQYRPLG